MDILSGYFDMDTMLGDRNVNFVEKSKLCLESVINGPEETRTRSPYQAEKIRLKKMRIETLIIERAMSGMADLQSIEIFR